MTAATPAERSRGSFGLWFAVLGGPTAWFVSLVMSYSWVHEACRHQSALGPRVVSVVALLLAVGSALGGRRIWKDTADERTRFMAQIGVMGGMTFSLIILLQILATMLLSPCHGGSGPRSPQSPDVLAPQIHDMRMLV
jgi:hypothetical protein